MNDTNIFAKEPAMYTDKDYTVPHNERAELEASIKGYDVSDLRESFTAREAVKQKVDLILAKFNF